MSEIIPFLIFVGVAAFAGAVKKKRQMNARAYRPRPNPDPIARANPAPVSHPAQPSDEERFDGAESAFESETDFTSGFGAEPDSSVTYEEGIDPCHDDMEHIAQQEDAAPEGMNDKTANELVRAFVMSEVLTRKRRR